MYKYPLQISFVKSHYEFQFLYYMPLHCNGNHKNCAKKKKKNRPELYLSTITVHDVNCDNSLLNTDVCRKRSLNTIKKIIDIDAV